MIQVAFQTVYSIHLDISQPSFFAATEKQSSTKVCMSFVEIQVKST